MGAGKIIGYIFAAITIFFGVLFIWGAFSPEGQPVWILIGAVSVLIGAGVIWLIGRQKPAGDREVTYQVDLGGDIDLDTLTCQSCGGSLSADNVQMVAGAPVVECPYCGSTYQISEKPKW
jgi:hypothetical protein